MGHVKEHQCDEYYDNRLVYFVGDRWVPPKVDEKLNFLEISRILPSKKFLLTWLCASAKFDCTPHYRNGITWGCPGAPKVYHVFLGNYTAAGKPNSACRSRLDGPLRSLPIR